MEKSILVCVAKACGVYEGDIEEEETMYESLCIHINDALDLLRDNGIGIKGVYVNDVNTTWEDFLGSRINLAGSVSSFVHAEVHPKFDPTLSTNYVQTLQASAQRTLWRLKENST